MRLGAGAAANARQKHIRLAGWRGCPRCFGFGGFSYLSPMPTPPRYGALAQIFADVAATLPAFQAFGYGVQANLDVQDSGQLPLLFLDAFIDIGIQNGRKQYTVGFYTLDKSTDNGDLTYTGNTPTDHHIARVLSRMELAGEQVIARLAQLADSDQIAYVLQEQVSSNALPIIAEYNGKLTGWRWELVLESIALNSYCELPDRPVLTLVGFAGPATSLSQDGSIDVLASRGLVPYTYTIDGGSANGTGEFTGLGEGAYELQVVDAASQASEVLTRELVAEHDCGDVLAFTVETAGLGDGSHAIDLLDGAGALFRAAIGTAAVSGGTATVSGLTLPCDNGGSQAFAIGTTAVNGVTNPGNAVGNTPGTFASILGSTSFLTLDLGQLYPAGTVINFELSVENALNPPVEYGFFWVPPPGTGGGQDLSSEIDGVDPGVKIVRTYTLPADARYAGLSLQPSGGSETIYLYRAWVGTAAIPLTTGRYELEAGGASLGELTINAA